MNKNEEIKEFQNYLISEAQSKNQDPEKYVKELGEEGLKEAYQRFQEYKKKKAKKAAHGAKLNYFKSLKNQCAEDEEVVYYKKGGSVGCGCKKKEEGGEVRKAGLGCSAVEKFKMQSGNKMIQFVDANKERKKKEEENKKREEKWRKGQIIVGKDIQRGNGGPDAKVQDSAVPKEDVPSHDPKPNTQPKPNKSRSKGGQTSSTAMKCGGSVVEKFKAKCGAKMKKHQQGGSLNGIPFYQKGTPEGGVTFYLPRRPITGAEAYMNDVAITDPQYQKYNNKAKAYSNAAPNIYNVANNILNKLKSSYYGNKAAVKAYYDEIDKYSRNQWNKGNYGEAIFGSPFVPIVRNYIPITEKEPLDVIKVQK